MSRWFVGSSSSSRSGSPASARASDARVSSPPENVESCAVEVLVAEAEPVQRRVDALAPACSRRRARAAPARARRRPASRRRSPVGHRAARARRAAPRARAGRRSRRARSRAGRGRGRAAGAGRAARSRTSLANASWPPSTDVSPASIRSSVVLPEPLRPDSVSRSRRSSLKETPRSRGVPAMSLARSDAIDDCHVAIVMVLSSRCAGPRRSSLLATALRRAERAAPRSRTTAARAGGARRTTR